MNVTHRAGEWTLGEKAPGVYLIKRRGHLRATVVTEDVDPDDGPEYLLDGGVSDVIEVEDVGAVHEEFRAHVADDARRARTR